MKAKLITREELKDLVGPGYATGIILNQCSPEDWRLWNKHVLAQGQPTAPNRAGRRRTAKLKQKALTKKRSVPGREAVISNPVPDHEG